MCFCSRNGIGASMCAFCFTAGNFSIQTVETAPNLATPETSQDCPLQLIREHRQIDFHMLELFVFAYRTPNINKPVLSPFFLEWRQRQRVTTSSDERKRLSLAIRKFQQKEARAWKPTKFDIVLSNRGLYPDCVSKIHHV